MIKISNRKANGFTLIEILVFTAIAGIFIVFTFSILNSFFKSRSTAKKLSLLQETSTYIFNELTQEVHWSTGIDSTGLPDRLILTQIQIDEFNEEIEVEKIFWVENEQLFKDGAPLSPPEIKINSFNIVNRAPEEKTGCLKIGLELEYRDSVPAIMAENQTTISLRETKFKALIE